jgi:hypothetical protein
MCDSCKERFKPRDIACKQCGRSFTIKTGTLIKCHKEHWDLPTTCHECKNDLLLIKGAIGALKGQFRFPLETTIEAKGIFFPQKVATVRNRHTNEVVAEVRMTDEGIFDVHRIAEVTLKESGEKISKTREAQEGFFVQQKVADTFDKSGAKTHRTRNVEKGIFFPKRMTETHSIKNPNAPPAITKTRDKGFLFPKRVSDTDKSGK